jgi:hypothetical protein
VADGRVYADSLTPILHGFILTRFSFDRYRECGVQGLTDRSRRPCRYAYQLPFQGENYILKAASEGDLGEAV